MVNDKNKTAPLAQKLQLGQIKMPIVSFKNDTQVAEWGGETEQQGAQADLKTTCFSFGSSHKYPMGVVPRGQA